MKTKQNNGFTGYGSTEEEANDSCQIISLLKSAYNAKGFENLEKEKQRLAPWKPKTNSLHIKGIGYVTYNNGSIKIGNKEVKTSGNMFEMLYKAFYPKLSMIELLLCANEIYEFMKENNIPIPKFSSYEQVIPSDIYMYDEDITTNIITDKYSIIFFKKGCVAIKRNAEELYWICNFDESTSSMIDALYYIAYVRGYEDMDSIAN